MKTLFVGLALLLSLPGLAQTLEAKPFSALLEQIRQTEFTYQESGNIFPFETTKSCFYKSDTLLVFRNYCSTGHRYPAQGYFILSKDFGSIELYEEDLTAVLKRDIRINQFPSILAPFLARAPANLKLEDYSDFFYFLSNQRYPACWSTNYSYYTQGPDRNCNTALTDIANLEAWTTETQTLLADEAAWRALLQELNAKFKAQ